MIKRISHISNFGIFKNFNWAAQMAAKDAICEKFNKINIIYGRNYSGKTTLSRIFRAFETKKISDPYTIGSFSLELENGAIITESDITNQTHIIVRTFNDDFVKDNLKFISNDDEFIEPFAILGEDNFAIQAEIKDIEAIVGKKESGLETGLYKEMQVAFSNYAAAKSNADRAAKSLDSMLTEKARQFRGIEHFRDINYNKTKLKSALEVIIREDIAKIDDKEVSVLRRTIGDPEKQTLQIPEKKELKIYELYRQCDIFTKQAIGDSQKIAELLRDSILNDWVKKGLKLHTEYETCLFCGNKISELRMDALNKHFDEESKVLEENLVNLIGNIENETARIADALPIDSLKFYSQFADDANIINDKYNAFLEKYTSVLSKICDHARRRIQSIAKPIGSMDVDLTFNYDEIYKEYVYLVEKNNEWAKNIQKNIENACVKLTHHDIISFANDIQFTAQCSEIQKLQKDAEAHKEEHARLNTKILQLEQRMSEKKLQLHDEQKGALLVNEYLKKYFGYNFLEIKAIESPNESGAKYKFLVYRSGIVAKHLSDGEKSLLSFCYFMAKLEEVSTAGTNPIVVIDDPISSLDSNHIFFIYSIISAEIIERKNYSQVFISTHHLDFLKYLLRVDGSEKSKRKEYFMVQRSVNESFICSMPLYMKNIITEFNYLFQEIYKCHTATSINDENYHTFYNFGNNARKFLELYLFYKYPNAKIDEKARMSAFFGSDSIYRALTNRINNEMSHLHGAIERGSVIPVIPEIHHVTKTIIDALKRDREQFDAFLCGMDIDPASVP